MTLTARFILTFAAVEAVFNPVVGLAFLHLLGYPSVLESLLVFALTWPPKVLVWVWYARAALRPYEAVARGASSVTEERLRQADTRLQQLPQRFAVFYSTTWLIAYPIGFALIGVVRPDLQLSSQAPLAVGLVSCAVWCGAVALAFPITSILTSGPAGEVSLLARRRGFSLERETGSLQIRIGAMAIALGLGPTLWMMALGYMKQVDADTRGRELAAEHAALRLALHSANDTGAPAPEVIGPSAPEGAPISESAVISVPTLSTTPSWLGADARRRLVDSLGASRSGRLLDGPNVVAFHRIGDREVAVVLVEAEDGSATKGFMISAGVFAIVVALWAPLSALVLARSVSGPLERLTESARQIVIEGKHAEMGALPVARLDEVGVLSERFNELIDMMRDLSKAALAIANGDLRVSITRQGDLPDAFRGMVDSLRTMVTEMRVTSVNLASAATEIFAASREQEAAAASQSSAMEEISRTMDSLSESAAHVSDAVQGVLDNAERTLENTDGMVKRIEQLSRQAGRIAEILDVIREIADRSDLLALNGSLEASRAGEGGQGFALVATEMRRLAERVTASVQDIKKLVADISDSGSTTVMATEESRRLAEGTTEAARQITFVSQQQKSGTEQVSQSVKNIAEVVTQSVSATSQTRTSAQLLKQQADGLAEMVRRFELSPAEAE